MKSIDKKLPIILLGATLVAFIVIFFNIQKDHLLIADITSPVDGILDLSSWNMDRDGAMSLNGEWEFYWQQQVTKADIERDGLKPDLVVKVPAVWNNYVIEEGKLPGFGTATYGLRVKNAPQGLPISIRMETVSTAYELFIDNERMASNGKIGTDGGGFVPEYRPQMITFIPQAEEFYITLQVANYSYARGGMWYPIYLGAEGAIRKMDGDIQKKDYFLIGAFLMMLLYNLSLFMVRREDKSSLAVALLCIIATGRVIIYGSYSILSIFPGIGYSGTVRIDYLTLIWFPVMGVLLIRMLFGSPQMDKLQRWIYRYAVFASFIILFFPIRIFTLGSQVFQISAVLVACYGVFYIVKHYKTNRIDASLIFMAGVVLTASGLHDALYQNNVIFTKMGEFSPVGFLILLFIQSVILARRYSLAYMEARLLSGRLMELDHQKDEFLANTSHEIRTPLNAMINITEALLRGSRGPLSSEQRETMSLVIDSGKRLSILVNNILDYSKLKNSELKLNREEINVYQITNGVLNELKYLVDNEKVEIRNDVMKDLPEIYADRNRLIQILYNLIGNAIKFTSEGYIRVHAVAVKGYVEISVEDTGSGIKKGYMDKVFKPYQQFEQPDFYSWSATGLGLAITKSLVEIHGGELAFESEENLGSRFYFTMPIADKGQRTGIQKNENPEDGTLEDNPGKLRLAGYESFPYRWKSDGPHIILVDDNQMNLLSLMDILKMNGYSITAVTSSKDFFQAFNEPDHIDLIILDIMLPDLSGYEICRSIRNRYSTIELPVLMLTARTSSQDILRGIQSGANDYLAKPFDADELLARVNTLVQLKLLADRNTASELEFLQAQIKPHFLFNAINTIIAISRVDNERAVDLLIHFSDYLRKSFDFKSLSQENTLRNELDLLSIYIQIEKARFEERIEVIVNSQTSLDAMVPILVLQPIVENAIRHGVLPKRKGGQILVSITDSEDAICFSVKDQGVGMPPERVESILKGDGGRGVGLSNIHNRLKKIYGSGLQIYTRIDEGTEVVWMIPVNKRKDLQ